MEKKIIMKNFKDKSLHISTKYLELKLYEHIQEMMMLLEEKTKERQTDRWTEDKIRISYSNSRKKNKQYIMGKKHKKKKNNALDQHLP